MALYAAACVDYFIEPNERKAINYFESAKKLANIKRLLF